MSVNLAVAKLPLISLSITGLRGQKFSRRRIKLAILISGGGTTAQAIIKACQKDQLKNIDPTIVISSDPAAKGIKRCQKLKIPTQVIQPKKYKSSQYFGQALLKILKKFHINLVSQNGWMPKTPLNVISAFKNKIINQHPGPLDNKRPDFGGQGMYGSRVTCARLSFLSLLAKKHQLSPKNHYTQATTQYVSQEFDKGQIIRVKKLNLSPLIPINQMAKLNTNHQLLIKQTNIVQTKLLPFEHQNVISTLADFATGKVPKFHRSKPLIPNNQIKLLNQAKKIAIKLFPKG